jgi:uncharacterized protein YoaH (UPF0181 family)
MAAGVTSTGGFAALVVSQLRDRNDRNKEMDTDNSEKGTGKGVSR